jgi:hypothetical protein
MSLQSLLSKNIKLLFQGDSWHFKKGLDGRKDIYITGSSKREGAQAELFFNGTHLCSTRVTNGKFTFRIKNAVGGIRVGSEISIRVASRPIAHESGEKKYKVTQDSPVCYLGKEKLLDIEGKINSGMRLTKKGTFSSLSNDSFKQEEYLDLYTELREWFRNHYARDLYVSHGTLLGAMRDGTFIPGDDDFDCFYLEANLSSAEEVVRSRLQLMQLLTEEGFKVFIGNTGHIKVKKDKTQLDIMPAWLEGNTLNISSYTSMLVKDPQKDLEPIQVELNGREVSCLTAAHDFLRYQYGDNWKVPDPLWRHSPSSAERLNRKALSPTREELEHFGIKSFRKRYLA